MMQQNDELSEIYTRHGITREGVDKAYEMLHDQYGDKLFGSDKPFGVGTGAMGVGYEFIMKILFAVHGITEEGKDNA